MTTARQPGLSTGLWGREFQPQVHLPQAAQAGFSSIELNIYLGPSHFDPTEANLRDLERVLADTGLSVWSIHSRDVGDLGHSDRPQVQRQLDELLTCVDLAERLGASVVVSHGLIISDPAVDATDRDFQMIDSLAELAPLVSPRGARIAFENDITNKPGLCAVDVLRRLIGMPRDAFGFVIDPGHANIAGDIDAILYGHGQRLISTHLNDNDGQRDIHLVPGVGTVEWPKVVRLIDESDYSGAMMYEVIAGSADPQDIMRQMLAAHARLFEGPRASSDAQPGENASLED